MMAFERNIARILKKVGTWVTTSEMVMMFPKAGGYVVKAGLVELTTRGMVERRERRGARQGQLDSLWRLKNNPDKQSNSNVLKDFFVKDSLIRIGLEGIE